MLTLTRRQGEKILIGDEIAVEVLGVTKGRVRLGIVAPKELAVHRGELVEKIQEENLRAVTANVEEKLQEHAIDFPEGILGLRDHKQFVICEVGDNDAIQALVSCLDTRIQLLIVDTLQVFPDFPVEEAQKAAGFENEEVALASIVTVPSDGSAATVNLAAPVVFGMESRKGKQVIVDQDELGVRHKLSVIEGAQSLDTAI